MFKSPQPLDAVRGRDVNECIVLGTLARHGRISQMGIAERTSLTKPTVSRIVKRLRANGLVREAGRRQSKGGRPRVLLELNGNSAFVLGADLSAVHVQVGLVDLRGQVLHAVQGPSTVGGGRFLPDDLVALFRSVLRATKAPRQRILGVGVGASAMVECQSGHVLHDALLGWHDVPLKEILEAELGLPTVVDSDCNALAMGELWPEGVHEDECIVYVIVARGVGASLIMNGELYRGAHSGAGEFGHTSVDIRGPRCDCGRRGCVEAVVSEPRLLGRARRELGWRKATMPRLIRAAQRGDPGATGLLADAGRYLGEAIANVVELLNPDRVIVGGDIAGAGDVFFDPLRAAVHRHPESPNSRRVRIEAPRLYGPDRIVGPAVLVLQRLFTPGATEISVARLST